MKSVKGGRGATLIELIFFMVVVSLAVVGIVPLVDQVFSSLHVAKEGAQGQFLAQAVLEQAYARNDDGGFDQIISEVNCLDRFSLASNLPMRCQTEVVGATFDVDTGDFNCKTHLGETENYKCITATIRQIDTNEVIARKEGSFPRKQDFP